MPTDKIFNSLLCLLRLAASDARIQLQVDEDFLSLTPDEWREIYRMAARHSVIAVAWDGVERMQVLSPDGLCSMPPDLMGKWFADVQSIEAANRRMAKLARQIQENLLADGFRSHILKGAALAAYYPVPAHRQSADIDLWVPPHMTCYKKSLNTQRKCLIGYLRQQPDVTVGEIVYHHIETTVSGTEVEFHVTPTWLCNSVHNRRLQSLFTQTGHLTPELQELYALLHAFRHIYHDGLALRHLLDYWLVRNQNREDDFVPPLDWYKQLGMTAFARTADELTDYVFGSKEVKANSLSSRTRRLLSVLPMRRTAKCVQWDYPGEAFCVLPWRTVHYLWRKIHHFV